MSVSMVVSVFVVGFVVVLGCANVERDTAHETDNASVRSDGDDVVPADNALSQLIAPTTTGAATCSASCAPSAPVSCSGASCSAQGRNCAAGQRGSVTCNGVTTSCAACGCTEGATRFESVGGCCCNYDDPTQPRPASWMRLMVCRNNAWVLQDTVCRGGNECGEGLCPV